MPITTESLEGVWRLTLQIPPVNAFEIEAVHQLGQFFAAYSNDRPLVLTGGGDVFSAGVDTKAFATYSEIQRGELFDGITRMVAALVAIDAPVLAAINGHALGGGFVLGLCADYRLVAEGDYKFGLTEAQAGVTFPDGPAEVIRDELPGPLLRHMALSSQLVPADLLYQRRVFDEVVPRDQLLDRARQKAVELAKQPAFTSVKQILRGDLRRRLASLAP